jgi:hypothetical protein
LRVQARENPVAFMGLLGKLVPSQIAAEVTQGVATGVFIFIFMIRNSHKLIQEVGIQLSIPNQVGLP